MSEHKLRNLLLEGLSVAEATSFIAAYYPLIKTAPQAGRHGRHVLVFPGFLTADITTAPLRSVLSGLGYETHGWDLGFNIGPTQELQARMEILLHALHRQHGKISLVGWSLGGLYARELARRYPHMVRQVITLGTPACHADPAELPPKLVRMAEHFTAQEFEELHKGFFKTGTANPPVPTTAVVSETDGVVGVSSALIEESRIHQNVRVYATHIGMGVNPGVLWVLAERLAKPTSRWARFRPPRNFFARFFPNQKPS